MATFTYGDYTITTTDSAHANIKATDKTKSTYSAMPSTVTYGGSTYTIDSASFCFENCTNLITPPTLPSSVESVAYCFHGCTNLTTAPTIPNSVTEMGACFYGCASLTTAPNIPSSVTGLNYCFKDCTNLTTAPTIPNSVTEMGACFENCTSLTTPPTIPSNVTSMYRCFYGCTNLTTAPTIPNKVTNMQLCFYGCTNLTTAPTIPSSVTNMRGTFWKTSLTTAPTIPSSVTNMRSTFNSCTNLTTAPTIPSSVTDIQYCFEKCTALVGNIIVNGTPTDYTEMFIDTNTANSIYIVNGGNASASTWRAIASSYQNVHYEADDNPTPTINSLNVLRVASNGSTTSAPTGTWAYIQALITIYDTYLPIGWSAGLKSRALTDNGTAVSPSWLPSPITSYPVTTYCWVDIDDYATHNISLTIADSITASGVEKASKTSSSITAVIAKSYALVDYYHDDITGTEGVAIGKLAEDADVLDIAMPTKFSDEVTIKDANNVFRTLLDYFYPVGSYYETSDTSFDPNVTWGGTWVEDTAGRVLISAGTNDGQTYTTGDAGGERTHILTPSETATKDHSHTINHTHGFTQPTITSYYRSTVSYSSGTSARSYTSSGSSSTTDWAKASGGAVQQHNGSSGGQTEANGSAHNNMQPYKVVKRWHRTA